MIEFRLKVGYLLYNNKEKTSIASNLVQSKMQDVESINFDRGNNIQFEIHQIDYDCLNTTMKIKTKLNI